MAEAPESGDVPTLSSDQVAAISRAIADPRRFAILQQVAAQPAMLCSCLDVQDSLSPATISHHLKELQAAGLLTVQREGRGMKLTLQRKLWEAYLNQLASLL